MRKVSVTNVGVVPILLTTKRSLNPMDPLVLEKATVSRKKLKTQDDHLKLKWLDFQLNLRWEDGVGVHLTAETIQAGIRKGASRDKNGKKVQAGLIVDEERIKLVYDNPVNSIAQLYKREEHVDYRPVRRGINVCRPRFFPWSVSYTIVYDGTILDLSEIRLAVEKCGQLCGFGSFRPTYGRFAIEEFKECK